MLSDSNYTEPSEEAIANVKSRHFNHLQHDIATLNHGAFGAAPLSVLDKAAEWSMKWRGATDHYYYNDLLLKAYTDSVKAVGPFVNALEPYTDHIALIDNATTGANIVAQALMWKFITNEYNYGDVILMWDCAYGAIQNAFHHHLDKLGARLVKIPMPFPLGHLTMEEANARFLEAMHSGIKEANCAPIRLVMLEHVSSGISMVFPLKQLVQLCRSHADVGLIFVDAAHAIGNVDVDVQELDVDYYVTNCHKWFFAPQSCAMFHSKHSFTKSVPSALELHHPIVSWKWNMGLFMESFWTGTRNLGEKLVIPDVVEVLPKLVRDLGLADDVNAKTALKLIQQYNHDRLLSCATQLAKAWGTSVCAPPELMSSMTMVKLPESLDVTTDSKQKEMRLVLINRFKLSMVATAVTCDEECSDGTFKRVRKGYVRIGHQIYVSDADFARLRDAILTLVDEHWGDTSDH